MQPDFLTGSVHRLSRRGGSGGSTLIPFATRGPFVGNKGSNEKIAVEKLSAAKTPFPNDLRAAATRQPTQTVDAKDSPRRRDRRSNGVKTELPVLADFAGSFLDRSSWRTPNYLVYPPVLNDYARPAMTYFRQTVFRFLLCYVEALGLTVGAVLAADAPPNIIYLLADDLGYVDLRCLNPDGKILTPHLDRLAAEGMIFTDAHSSSSVCTPTRYALLTGRYNWRSRLKSGVLGGLSPPLIEPGRLTVASFLRQQGYRTACIGKWHLGFEWPRKAGTEGFTDAIEKGADGWRVDFSKPIAGGPLAYGFDSFFGLAASLDMVPYAFIDNDHVTKIPTVDRAFPMMFGRTNGMTRKGPGAADFEAADVLPTLTRRAVAFLDEYTKPVGGQPFFLYVPFNAPHTPILPSQAWRGRSGLNPYADFVMETDACVGTILDALERKGLANQTLVVFASDNGCSPEANFPELRARGHDPNAHLRGAKADIFEGGHRVPFMVRWPGRVKPGTTCAQLVGLHDFFATCADIVGIPLPPTAAEDSVSLLPALEGRAGQPLHEALVHHSINGSFAIRRGHWKLILGADSGDWSSPQPGSAAVERSPSPQLYDLANDRAEKHNVAASHPEVVAELTQLLKKIVTDGRSTPGSPQRNTTPVEIQRKPHGANTKSVSPNILFVVADQWRAQAFGFAGDPNVQTPQFDRFERQCVNFTQAVSGMPVCSPTRASLLTGQRPATHGVFLNDVPLKLEAVTLPKVLRESGYDTACIGKWHLDGHGSRSGFIPRERRQGFDYWKVLESTHAYNNSPYYGDGPEKLKWDGYDAIAQTRDAQTYLRDRARAGRPFLLWLAWGPPHNPYETAPARYQALYQPETIQLHPNVPVSAQARARRELAGYYAHCTALDDCMGELLRTLDETGLATNTVVVFTSDHGDMLWSQDQQRKQRPWEESVRVPMLWRVPPSLGVSPQRLAATINTEDVMPTLLSLCERTVPRSVEGFDFTNALRGGADPSGGATIIRCLSPFGEFTRAQGGREYRGVRTVQHTYVRDLKGPWLLYDNLADPYQLRNLAGNRERTSLLVELDALLAKKLTEQHDDFRPGPEYIQKWGYAVDAGGTMPYQP